MKLLRRSAQTWELVPYEGVGPVLFGSTRSAARKVIGQRAAAVDREHVHIDQFSSLGLNVDYDVSDQVQMVTVYENTGRLSITLEGTILMPGQSVSDLITSLQRRGDTAITDGEGVLFRESGVGLLTTGRDPDDPETEIEGVTFFGPGRFPH